MGRQKGVLLLWHVHSGSRVSLLVVFALGGILFKLEPVLSSILISTSRPVTFIFVICFFNGVSLLCNVVLVCPLQ